MILNNAPVNEAIVSNVNEIGEFRIRNSAKAFSILSSGLYANKIRAIVRELSCNAVDSHVAAGKQDTPFDVHFPSQLEPWFSIRDYGTGLTHEQVSSIYTTYFESTKTDSNAFIGALGLGSKSPFSYTDNFTVTAIKDGKRGVYSAFINEAGVPSIALMMTEETTDPAGVEVKFSVNDYWDFGKFRDEARHVYTYFKLRPVTSGGDTFEFREVSYETENIIPGVHSVADRYARDSKAIMGNIAYPIDVPNAEKNLGNLADLLNCGLEMHFGIGELDFQASREGLSYIPSTIDSIRKKLVALNDQLAKHIATEADAITNLWERAFFLYNKRNMRLWTAAVEKYVTDTKFPLLEVNNSYVNLKPFKIKTQDLATRFNIAMRGFQKSRGSSGVSMMSSNTSYDRNKADANGNYITWTEWQFNIEQGNVFVINDLKVGATERAKYHFRNTVSKADDPYTRYVYVLEAADKTKPINSKAFFRALKNPPANMVVNASDLLEKERKSTSGGLGRNVSILKMAERGTGGYYRQQEMVWRDAGKISEFDSKTTYYYLPLSGYSMVSERLSNYSGKSLVSDLVDCGVPALNFTVYGVRKTDIEHIKTLKNWVNAEEHIEKVLKNLTADDIKGLAMGTMDSSSLVRYNESVIRGVTNPKSPYAVITTAIKNAPRTETNRYDLETLCKTFDVQIDLETPCAEITAQSQLVFTRYPLLSNLNYRVDDEHISEYINAIDKLKGVK